MYKNYKKILFWINSICQRPKTTVNHNTELMIIYNKASWEFVTLLQTVIYSFVFTDTNFRRFFVSPSTTFKLTCFNMQNLSYV